MNIVDSGFMFNDAIKTLMAVKSEYFFFKIDVQVYHDFFTFSL
jgi:hypothetical protein